MWWKRSAAMKKRPPWRGLWSPWGRRRPRTDKALPSRGHNPGSGRTTSGWVAQNHSSSWVVLARAIPHTGHTPCPSRGHLRVHGARPQAGQPARLARAPTESARAGFLLRMAAMVGTEPDEGGLGKRVARPLASRFDGRFLAQDDLARSKEERRQQGGP